jgi:hypothetical protein
MVSAFVFAFRNSRAGRADWKGATRLAGALFAMLLAINLLRGHDLLHWSVAISPLIIVGPALWTAIILAAAYVAMEPFVRRRWPTILVTWTRVMHGAWRDSTVGRDLLVGMAASVVPVPLFPLAAALTGGVSAPTPPLDGVRGVADFIGWALFCLVRGLGNSVGLALVLFLFRLALRRDWAAACGCVVMVALWTSVQIGVSTAWYLALFGLLGIVHAWLLIRFGLLALASGITAGLLLLAVRTLDSTQWHAPYSYMGIALMASLGVGACLLATRPPRESYASPKGVS